MTFQENSKQKKQQKGPETKRSKSDWLDSRR